MTEGRVLCFGLDSKVFLHKVPLVGNPPFIQQLLLFPLEILIYLVERVGLLGSSFGLNEETTLEFVLLLRFVDVFQSLLLSVHPGSLVLTLCLNVPKVIL